MSQRQRLERRLAHRLAVDEHHRSRRHVEAQGAVAGHGFGPGLRPGFVTGCWFNDFDPARSRRAGPRPD